MVFRKRRAFRRKTRRRRRFRRSFIRKAMRIRRSRIELKYINLTDVLETPKNSATYHSITPLSITQGTGTSQRIGIKIKFRWLKLFFNVQQVFPQDNPDNLLYFLQLRIMLLKPHVGQNAFEEEMDSVAALNSAPNPLKCKIMWEQEFTIANRYLNNDVIPDSFGGQVFSRNFSKSIRIPLNVTYDNENNIAEWKDRYILFVMNRTQGRENYALSSSIDWRARTSYIDI